MFAWYIYLWLFFVFVFAGRGDVGVCVCGGNTALLPFMIYHMFPINFSDTEKLCVWFKPVSWFSPLLLWSFPMLPMLDYFLSMSVQLFPQCLWDCFPCCLCDCLPCCLCDCLPCGLCDCLPCCLCDCLPCCLCAQWSSGWTSRSTSSRCWASDSAPSRCPPPPPPSVLPRLAWSVVTLSATLQAAASGLSRLKSLPRLVRLQPQKLTARSLLFLMPERKESWDWLGCNQLWQRCWEGGIVVITGVCVSWFHLETSAQRIKTSMYAYNPNKLSYPG